MMRATLLAALIGICGFSLVSQAQNAGTSGDEDAIRKVVVAMTEAGFGAAICAPPEALGLLRIRPIRDESAQRAGDDGRAGHCGPRSRSDGSSRISAVGTLRVVPRTR